MATKSLPPASREFLDIVSQASYINPFSDEYLEQQRRRLPEHIYRRLHRNEWSLADDARVFHIAPECWQLW